MNNAIQTKHNLDFEACPWDLNPKFALFRIGTCEGQWFSTPESYCIVAVINNEPKNGHLEDVFQWFEYSCKRDKKSLRIMEFFNQRFKRHCILKRGFKEVKGTNDVIKKFV